MERVVGDPISSAIWVNEELDADKQWSRASTMIKECLSVDGWILFDEPNRLSWIADSLTINFEYRKTLPLPQYRITIETFEGFATDEDGWFLTNSLNHKVVGGAFIYDRQRKSIDFVSYCAIADWQDFALLILSVTTATGQCETMSRREDVLRYNKCRGASRFHSIHESRREHHKLFLDRFWDVAQLDYVSGLWISERERAGVLELINSECSTIEIHPNWSKKQMGRNIECLDFNFQVFPPKNYSDVFRDFSAFASIEFNAWTDFGRAITIDVGLPLFTWHGIFDDGASHDLAVHLSNQLNMAANETCWQKLGLGSWNAKGSQIYFSMIVPHANLKPVIMGSPRFDVADVIFEIINPNMIQRMINIATHDLSAMEFASRRDPQEMDSMAAIKHLRRKIEPLRCSTENATLSDTCESYWDMPSTPLLIYGIFDPVGSSLGSIEVVYTRTKTLIVNRLRFLGEPNETVLATLGYIQESALEQAIEDSIAALHDMIVIPDFLNVPLDVVGSIRDSVLAGLNRLIQGFGKDGIDISLAARHIRSQPNPNLRSCEEGFKTQSGDLDQQNMEPIEEYLLSAMQYKLVDYNLSLFPAWWQAELSLLNDPKSPDKAAEVAATYMQHAFDRSHGPHQT